MGSEGIETKIDYDKIPKLIHPTDTQDMDCPEIKWMGYDLGQCPGYGDWKCKSQKVIDKFEGTTDYKACNCRDYKKCPVYLKKESSKSK